MKQQPEFQLQKQICQFLRLKYPSVLFMSDTVAFLSLTMPQAVRNKQIQNQDFHAPDLVIFEPRGNYHGFFLELKTKSIYKKDGVSLLKNDHVSRQIDTIEKLNRRGYLAAISWDFQTAVKMIEHYLKSWKSLSNRLKTATGNADEYPKQEFILD